MTKTPEQSRASVERPDIPSEVGPNPSTASDPTMVKTWKLSQIMAVRAHHSLVVAIISSVGAPLMWLLGPPAVNSLLAAFFGYMTINNALYFESERRSGGKPSLRKSHFQFGSMQVVTWIFLFTFMYRIGGDPSLSLSYRILGFAIYLILAEQVDMFSPLSIVLSLLGSICHVASGLMAWHLAKWDHISVAATVLGTMHAWMWYQRIGVYGMLVDQAGYWIEARQLELQNDHLNLAAIERDLEFTRELKSGAEDLPSSFRLGKHLVEVFQQSFETIGGDWVAMRRLEGDSTVFVVADVNGKGMPAAMVAQSLQTLWVKSQSDPDFDSVAWLSEVNTAMYTLGRREPYTLTLAMVIIDAANLTYVSAGHVPLIVIHDLADPKSVRQVIATGTPLGMAERIDVSRVSIPLPTGPNYAIMFGSDGIINLKMRQSRKAVMQFAGDLRSRGREAIADYPEKDDKTLVVLRAG